MTDGKKIKAVLFDLDGTVLDTLGDLCDSLNYALISNGFPPRTLDETRRFLGSGVAKLIARAIPDGEENPLFSKCHDDFRAYYPEHMELKTAPYQGVTELLEALIKDGYRLAVVSNKFDGAVKVLCRRFFSDLLEAAVGEGGGIRRKPAPDAAFEALRLLGCSPAEAVYVGDSEVDIQTAANAGIPCISVTWGFRSREYLVENGTKVLADTPEELLAIIRDL